MSTTRPIRFGLAGLGGYAAYVCDRLLDEARQATPAAQLVAVFDPHLGQFRTRAASLHGHGVRALASFEALLTCDIDAVWLPIPIDLHRPYTEAALAAGKAVLCEKPAAGCVDDVDAMIAARDRSGLPVAVGFQDAYQPAVEAVKRRILAGEFGRARSAQVLGCWPRGQRYFGRNDWAGRLRREGRWVVDGPAGNALAHFLHLPLLLLGPTLQEALTPLDVTAELYRVNPIESYDTCSLRYTLPGDIPMHVAFTHACAKPIEPFVVIEFDRARLRYVSGQHVETQRPGETEILPLSPHPHHEMLRTFQRWVLQGPENLVGATLESARAQVVAVNAAVEAAVIHDVPDEFVDELPARDHATLRTIRDIGPALLESMSRRCLLHETGRARWARAAASMHINGYSHFRGPVRSPPADELTTPLQSQPPAQPRAGVQVTLAPRGTSEDGRRACDVPAL
jgi:predicted dehydrogenase